MEFNLIYLKEDILEIIISKGSSGILKKDFKEYKSASLKFLEEGDLNIFISEKERDILKEGDLNLEYILLESVFKKAYENLDFPKDKEIEFYLTLFNYIRKELNLNTKLSFEKLKIIKSLKLNKDMLIGKNILFTGGLSHMKRGEAMGIVRSFKGNPMSSFSKNIDILVCGKNKRGYERSTKRRKAEELISRGYNILLLDEEEFFKIIK